MSSFPRLTQVHGKVRPEEDNSEVAITLLTWRRNGLIYFQSAFGAPSALEPISEADLSYALELMRESMRQGALGFGFGITYTPGASHGEIYQAFAAAAELEAPVFVHMRGANRMGIPGSRCSDG